MPNTRAKTNAAIALDLGSTRFKIGCIDSDGRLSAVAATSAPRMSGSGLVREADAAEFLSVLDALLTKAACFTSAIPFGLVCQRSTFLIWDRDTGQALTPIVSWQDRRAAQWCDRHRDAEAMVRERTGLPLSPHYCGPKLAVMLNEDPGLATRLVSGDALFGNLDAWLTWRWTDGAVHRTDLTMAARTSMVDIATGGWSDDLLQLFAVPRAALPEIVATDTGDQPLNIGGRLRASIADQAAGALAVLDPSADSVLVNLGTGGFVLRPVADSGIRRDGYLTAPILATARSAARYVLEGTINGAGPAVDRFGSGPTLLPAVDPVPDGFAIPDIDGIGAPHWRPDVGLTLSAAARNAGAEADQRRIVIEGLVFRVYEILRDVADEVLPDIVYLSGGLANEPAIASGLAKLLDAPVDVLDESETTLLGTARLAAGMAPFAGCGTTRVERSDAGNYLPEKFGRWQEWMLGVLSGTV